MITIYTTKNCLPCKYSKKKLDDAGVEYKERKIENLTENEMDTLRSFGFSQMPVIVNGEKNIYSGKNAADEFLNKEVNND